VGFAVDEKSIRSTRAQLMGKVSPMKHLLAGVAIAALIGLAPAAMAQSATQTSPNFSQGSGTAGKEAIKDQRESNSMSGATTSTPSAGSTGLNTSDTRSAPNKGAAAGTKGPTSDSKAGTAGSGTTMGTSGSTSSGTSGMSGSSSMDRSGMSSRGADSSGISTQQLNQQELSRVRSAPGG
jgi:hypothetical protein